MRLPDRRPPARAPFVVVVDQREKAPYTFQGIEQNQADGGRILDVPRAWRTLSTGDYSIEGAEDRVAIERKSLDDLYSSLGQNRERFEREHERLSDLEFAAVVIEASWARILDGAPRSRLNPKTVWRTALSWSIRYGVQWFTLENRRLAEIGTYRLLECWWKFTSCGWRRV